MPIRSRRREEDGRADRLESEVRDVDAQRKDFAAIRKFMCSGCKHMYEERSRVCPRCDKKTMGELKQIPERHLDEAHRKAIRRLKEGIR